MWPPTLDRLPVRYQRRLRLGKQVESYIEADHAAHQQHQASDDPDRAQRRAERKQRNREEIRSGERGERLREKWGVE